MNIDIDFDDDVFETETDEGELLIRPYEVDCLPNDYNISVIMNLIQRLVILCPENMQNQQRY